MNASNQNIFDVIFNQSRATRENHHLYSLISKAAEQVINHSIATFYNELRMKQIDESLRTYDKEKFLLLTSDEWMNHLIVTRETF